tara:strand:+ start:1703 stop:2179 length:477 start_codon:yes stop_codon:yes gene_type:complete
MNHCETCTICFEETNSFHALNCCDAEKKICLNCINCLRSPQCPYCREQLCEELFINNSYVRSAPQQSDWSLFVEEEFLINPYDPEFIDSRILRRQMRRVRRRFLSEQNRIIRNRNTNQNSNRASARTRRQQRKQARQQLRNSLRLNNNTFDIQFELEL